MVSQNNQNKPAGPPKNFAVHALAKPGAKAQEPKVVGYVASVRTAATNFPTVAGHLNW